MSGRMAPLEPLRTDGPRARLGWLWLAGAAGALALYVATLAPDLVWQDSGDYQFEAARLNLSRPGDAVRVHPWFLATAWALARPGLWNYAYAANLSSAVGTAVAVANVLVLVRLMTGRVGPAIIAAVALAVGHTVWAHAVMAETYGWAAALLSAECLCAWAWLAARRARWILLLFLLDGMAISNHLMAGIGLVVFALWVLYECLRGRAAWWLAPAAAGCWVLGGTLYWIVVAQEYVRTGSAMATLRSATVGAWAGSIFNVTDLPLLLWRSVLYVGLNFPTPLVLAGLVGAAGLARRRDVLGRLVLILAAVYLAWAARYKVPDQYAFFIPFYVMASVLIGVGVSMILRRYDAGASGPAPGSCTGAERACCPWAARGTFWLFLALALMPVGVYVVLPGAARRAGLVFFQRELPYRDPYVFFLQPWRTGDDGARRFAEEVLGSLPPGAVLFSDTTPRPPLVCLQQLEGRRPDVLLATPQEPRDEPGGRYWFIAASPLGELAAAGRRVFVVSDHPDYMPKWMAGRARLVPFGHIFEVVGEPQAAGGAR